MTVPAKAEDPDGHGLEPVPAVLSGLLVHTAAAALSAMPVITIFS